MGVAARFGRLPSASLWEDNKINTARGREAMALLPKFLTPPSSSRVTPELLIPFSICHRLASLFRHLVALRPAS